MDVSSVCMTKAGFSKEKDVFKSNREYLHVRIVPLTELDTDKAMVSGRFQPLPPQPRACCECRQQHREADTVEVV